MYWNKNFENKKENVIINIVTISKDTFEKLLKSLYKNDKKINEFIDKLPNDKKEVIRDKDSLFKEFVREFVKKSGSRSADLIFDFINPVHFLRGLISE